MAFACSACPSRVSDSQNKCLTCGATYSLWPDFGAATAGFATIYTQVTGRLRSLATQADVNAQDTAWLLYLIQSFHNQYAAWQWKPTIREYLRNFHRRRTPRLFSLSGDVYLHISYDLPRVIADSLSRVGPDDFNLQVINPTTRFNARVLYLSGGAEFYKVLDEHATTFSVAGFFAFPAVIGRRLSALQVLGHWVIALRSVAWIHAEALCEPVNRAQLEDRLLMAVSQAATIALRSPWNPARWSIPAPVLAISAVAILAGCAAPIPIGTTLLVAASGLVAYAAMIYGLTLRAIDTLGRAMFERVSAVLAEDTETTTERAQISPPPA